MTYSEHISEHISDTGWMIIAGCFAFPFAALAVLVLVSMWMDRKR